MSITNILIVVIVLLLIGLAGFLTKRRIRINAEKERIRVLEEKKRHEEERLRLELLEKQRKKDIKYVESRYQEVSSLNKDFDSFLNHGYGYFNHKKLLNWKSTAGVTYQAIEKMDLNKLQLDEQYLTAFNKFRKYGSEGEAIRVRYNTEFVKKELVQCNDLFSNIDGASLD